MLKKHSTLSLLAKAKVNDSRGRLNVPKTGVKEDFNNYIEDPVYEMTKMVE